MASDWHDINAPGFPVAKAAENAVAVDETGPVEEAESRTKEPEVRFVSGQFAPHPVHGYGFNEKCLVRVRADYLRSTTRNRIELTLRATYAGAEQDLGVFVEANLDGEGCAEFEVPLYYHDRYYDDRQAGTLQGAVDYVATVTHSRHVEPLVVGPFAMPADSDPPLLKRGRYDDEAVARYESRTTDGAGYLTGTPVFALQRILERFRFAPGPIDGDFGPRTEEAVRAFQECALGESRKLGGKGTIVEVEPGFPGPVDGVVGPVTREEIRVWDREGYVKPERILVRGDFDDEAHRRGLRDRRDAEEADYYHAGTPVRDMQQRLAGRGFTEVGEADGAFGPKTERAVKAFRREAARSARRLEDGSAVEAEEAFGGEENGRWSDTARTEMDKWEDNGWYRCAGRTGGFNVRFVDVLGEPLRDIACTLTGPEGELAEETLADGALVIEDVPCTEITARIRCGEHEMTVPLLWHHGIDEPQVVMVPVWQEE